MGRNDTKVYVGNLPSDVKEREVEDIFSKYGRIRNVEVKGTASRGPLFAFVEFDDPRGRDGYDFDGHRIRVEMTRGSGPRGPGGRPMYGRDDREGGFRSGRDGFRSDRGRGAPPKRSENRVVIDGLPSTGSWQDLKDHMREAGEVCYADVARDGTGVVEFIRREDMEYALKNLDDTKFKSHKGDTSYIHLREDSGRGGGGSRRSRSPRRSPQYKDGSRPSASPRNSVSRSRSRS